LPWYREKNLFLFLLILATVLRLALASANKQANDPHYEQVIQPIADREVRDTVLSRFHPKLFHRTAAALVNTFGTKGDLPRRVLIQWMNALVGVGTLILIWLALGDAGIPSVPKLLAFGWVALNPGIIGINAQVTNDTFVVFFSVLATYLFVRFLRKPRLATLLWLMAAASGATATKGNGIILIATLLVVLATRGYYLLKKKDWVPLVEQIVCAVALIVVTAGTAVNSKIYLTHGAYDRFMVSPDLYPGKYWGNLAQGIRVDTDRGITILTKSFLTFRLFDLVEHPRNDVRRTMFLNTGQIYPYNHMSSYWSQIYGNGVSIRFHDWPPTWQSREPALENLSRWLLILNLLPVALLFGGLFRPGVRMGSEPEWLGLAMLTIFAGLLLAGMRYYMLFPQYQFGKFIYLAPFLVALTFALAKGLTLLKRAAPKVDGRNLQPWLFHAVTAWFVLLFIIDTIDVVWLVASLT